MLFYFKYALKVRIIDLWSLTLRFLIFSPFSTIVPYYKFVDETISFHLSTTRVRKQWWHAWFNHFLKVVKPLVKTMGKPPWFSNNLVIAITVRKDPFGRNRHLDEKSCFSLKAAHINNSLIQQSWVFSDVLYVIRLICHEIHRCSWKVFIDEYFFGTHYSPDLILTKNIFSTTHDAISVISNKQLHQMKENS